MCGLAGFFAWGSARPSPTILKAILVAQEPKGTDSSGYAFVDTAGKIRFGKDTVKPTEFVQQVTQAKWEEIADSHTATFHARNSTRGSKTDNKNSHPQEYKGWVITHNGTLTNDDDLFYYYKTERFAEVDSAAIPLVLSQGSDYKDSIRHLSLLGGSATIAVLCTASPERLALVRLGRHNLFLFMDLPHKILYWSSVASAVVDIPGYSLGNIGFSLMSKMP